MTDKDTQDDVSKVHRHEEALEKKRVDLAVKSDMHGEDFNSKAGVLPTAEAQTIIQKNETQNPNSRKNATKRMMDHALRQSMKAIDDFYDAFDSATRILSGMSVLVDNMKHDIDRLDFLMQGIERAGELLKNGTKEDKQLWLLMNGIDQADIDEMSRNGTLDDGVRKLRADMAEEYSPLHKKVAQDAEKYQELEKQYLDEDAKMAANIEKVEQEARDSGMSDEDIAKNPGIQKMHQDRAEKKQEFEKTQGVFVDNMKRYADMHGAEALDKVVAALDEEQQGNNYFRLGKENSLSKKFEVAANRDADEIPEQKNDIGTTSKPVEQALANRGLSF